MRKLSTKQLFSICKKDNYTMRRIRSFSKVKDDSECQIPIDGTEHYVSIYKRKVYINKVLIPKHLY